MKMLIALPQRLKSKLQCHPIVLSPKELKTNVRKINMGLLICFSILEHHVNGTIPDTLFCVWLL